jgi:hypothetical protein
MESDDFIYEMVVKAGGEIRVFFNDSKDAEAWLQSHQVPPPLFKRSYEDGLIIYELDEDAKKCSMVYAEKKVKDLLSELSELKAQKSGWLALVGDQGFIIKYEPGPDKLTPFKSASINGFLKLSVDHLDELLQKYVYGKPMRNSCLL